ncbi:MAG: sugar phosphate isomerase/epimerase [Lentisphaeria bacterium]|nr:sugar phosphate isomerase/epimerase [Lentisphaeria bacterium]
MNADAFSVSGFYRWNRTDDSHISQACAEFAQAGTRFLAADAETVKNLLEQPGRLKELCSIAGREGLIFRDAHAVWGAGNDLNELTDEPSFATHEKVIPILADCGIRTMTFHIGASCIYGNTWRGNEEKYRGIAAAALERLLKTAEKHQLTLAVENCFEPSTTAQEAMALVKRFPSPYLGLCLDCGHANLMEPREDRDVRKMVGYIQKAWQPGIPEFTPGIAEYMAPEIVTVHVHDNDGLNDLHTVIDEHGTIDWKRIRKVLSGAPRLISLQSEADIASFSIAQKADALQRPFA